MALSKTIIGVLRIGYSSNPKAFFLFPLTVIATTTDLIGISLLVPLVRGTLGGDYKIPSSLVELFTFLNLSTTSVPTLLSLLLIVFSLKFILTNIQNYYSMAIPYGLSAVLADRLVGKLYENKSIHFTNQNTSNNFRLLYSDVKEYCGKTFVVAVQLIVEVTFLLIFFAFLIHEYTIQTLILGATCTGIALVFYLSTHALNSRLGSFRRHFEKLVISDINFVISFWRYISTRELARFIRSRLWNSFGRYARFSLAIAVQPTIIRSTIEFIVVSIFILVVYVGSTTHPLDPNFLIFIGLSMIRFLPSINRIISGISTLSHSEELVDRLLLALGTARSHTPTQSSPSISKGSRKSDNIVEISKGEFFHHGSNFSLEIPHLVIPPRGLVIIRGESGAGKSTLIDIILGHLALHRGMISYNFRHSNDLFVSNFRDGNICESASRDLNLNENIALLPQVSPDFENYSDIFLDIVGGGVSTDAETFGIHTRRLGVSDVWANLKSTRGNQDRSHKTPVSGGELQRILFSLVLSQKRPLTILDEPTSALDSKNRLKVYDVIYEHASKHSIVLVTHDPEFKFEGSIEYQIANGRLYER
jgi:ABC-type cobalamin/Fe3+-siderophores transport system ATPase subunit